MPRTHAALIDLNKRWLRQALDLLGQVDHERFPTSPAGMAPHRVSSHLRHIIEFYECFLAGLESAHIDYDSRKRDLSIESNPESAAARISSLIDRLDSDPALEFDMILFVRAEDADGLGLADPYLLSSVARELMTLSSHTIHHFALIAMALRALGMAIAPNFGVAPSTLHRQHQLSLQAA